MMATWISWPKLIPGILLMGILSLSVHVAMLERLAVPYPGIAIHAPFFQFLSRGLLVVLGLIYPCDLAQPFFARRSYTLRWATIFVLSTTLTEGLIRLPFMGGWCSNSLL